MLEETISRLYKETEHTWKTKQGWRVQPDEEDVQKVLDEAARSLYNEPIGSRFNIGGLIVERAEKDFIVYALVGRYK